MCRVYLAGDLSHFLEYRLEIFCPLDGTLLCSRAVNIVNSEAEVCHSLYEVLVLANFAHLLGDVGEDSRVGALRSEEAARLAVGYVVAGLNGGRNVRACVDALVVADQKRNVGACCDVGGGVSQGVYLELDVAALKRGLGSSAAAVMTISLETGMCSFLCSAAPLKSIA